MSSNRFFKSTLVLLLAVFIGTSSGNSCVLDRIKENYFSDWEVEQGLKILSFLEHAQKKQGDSIVQTNKVLESLGFENPLCSTCHDLVSGLNTLVSSKKVQFVIEAAASTLCTMKMSSEMCWGIVVPAGGAIADNLVEFLLDKNYFCEWVVPVCRKEHYERLEPQEYIDRVLSDKPDLIQGDDFVENLYKQIAEDTSERRTIKVVHIADAHLDLDYVAGTDSLCPEWVVSCRTYCGYPSDPKFAAGQYGSFGCDLPFTSFELMNHFINDEVKPDALFWTGDIVPHDFWNYDEEYVELYQNTFSRQLLTQFPDLKIYPIHGNHDFQLINSQNLSEPDPILDFNTKIWSQWMTDEAIEEYKKAGYYHTKFVLSDGTETKTNIIAINTQSCYIFNFFLMSLRNDPGDELDWLEQTLATIEAKGESAVILGHVPAGEQCLYEFSIRFKALVERYQHIIRFSMYGHVHEEFHGIYRSFSTPNPIASNYWTGSVSTYSNKLPSFRMFEIDLETFLPLKIHTYILNITEEEPEWRHDHEFTDMYDLKDLSPSSMDALSQRFLEEEELAILLHNTRTQQVALIDECDEECRLEAYCWTRNSVYLENKDCQNKERYNVREDPLMTMAEKFSDPWFEKVSTEE